MSSKKSEPKKNIANNLNLKQEEFCQLFVSSDKEFFGNGVQCYIEVYEPDTSQKNWYKTACSAASRMLSNVKVCERINELLDEAGFNDHNVDKQHLFLINQHANLSVKMTAIKEYNELRQRIQKRLGVEDKDGNTIAAININVHRPESVEETENNNDNSEDPK